jgi:hypothetical protein
VRRCRAEVRWRGVVGCLFSFCQRLLAEVHHLVPRMLLALLRRILFIGASLCIVNCSRRVVSALRCGVCGVGAYFNCVCCDYAAMFAASVATYEALFVLTSLANRIVCVLALALVL